MVDLIYTDTEKQDVGVLNEYAYDCAFGKDENSFKLVVPHKNLEISRGCLIYVENSDIGGIVDKVGVDTANRQITYEGRTWQGIIDDKILMPGANEDYLVLSGEANEVIGDIIDLLDIGDLFEASTDVSDFEIVNYYTAYTNAYQTIVDMLFSVTAKLKMVYNGDKVVLSAVPYIDYSLDEEWSADKKDFTAKRDYVPVNHMICLGKGDLENRYVIHLFADEAGNIQEYATTEEPYEDADYILDEQNKVIDGIDERVVVLDSGNAQISNNYIITTSKPSDFDEKYFNYYQYDEERDKYSVFSDTKVERLQLLKYKPDDWDTNVTDYYTVSGSKASQPAYELLTSKPDNWSATYISYYEYINGEYKKVGANTDTNKKKISKKQAKKKFKNGQYKKLYTRYWDGTTWQYVQVSDVSYDRYKKQTKKPSDWNNNFGHYYQKKKKAKGYETVKGVKKKQGNTTVTVAPTWKIKKYYTKYTYRKAPKYDKTEDYYQDITKTAIPQWQTNKYYEAIPNYTMPAWQANTFYMKVTEERKPEWDKQDVYELKEDHFAVLVQNGIEKFQELQDCDTIDISLRNDIDYDIGDVVGAVDEITGIGVWQPITKKIITISRHKKSISYEIGGKTYGNGSSNR